MPQYPRTDLFSQRVTIEGDIAFQVSEQLESNVHERFHQRFGWLADKSAPPTQTSMLSIVKNAQAIGIVTLTRSNEWVIISDMELEPEWRGKELGSAAVIAVCDYLSTDTEWSELIHNGPLIPSVYGDESGRRFLARLMSQGLAEPLYGSAAYMITYGREPIDENPQQRIMNIHQLLAPIWYGLQKQSATPKEDPIAEHWEGKLTLILPRKWIN